MPSRLLLHPLKIIISNEGKMMRPVKESIANKALVLKAINKFGGCTAQELAQITQLTKNQVKVALHEVTQTSEAYKDGNNYYSSTSKFESSMVHKLWNSQVFSGLQL